MPQVSALIKRLLVALRRAWPKTRIIVRPVGHPNSPTHGHLKFPHPDCALIRCSIMAVLPADLERVIVDSTAQSKAIAHPVDSRLLKIARQEVVSTSNSGNPYNGHVLSAQQEQTTNLLQDLGRSPKQVIVDLGYRGLDADNPGVQIIHRGKYRSLSDHEKRPFKRRQAIEPLIGHAKADHRMDRCWLQGAVGDELHALCCAAGYNIRRLPRSIVRLGLQGLFWALSAVVVCVVGLPGALLAAPKPAHAPTRTTPLGLPAARSQPFATAV